MVLRHTPKGTPYVGPPYTWAERQEFEARDRAAMTNPRPMSMLPGRVRTASNKTPASDAANPPSRQASPPEGAGSDLSKEAPPKA